MKKVFALSLILGLATLARATVTIDFTVGILTGSDGVTPISDGSLIQLIAAPTTGGLVAPTATAFTSGSEVLLWSGAFNSATTGTTGSMDIAPGPLTITAGWAFMVQWFPTLTTAASAPGNSTPYGQYKGQFSPDGSIVGDLAWTAPADGSTVSYNFLTVSSGAGSIANSAAAATQSTAPIPEPSTYAAIFGVCALGLAAYRRRQQAA